MMKPSVPQGTRDLSPEVVRKRQYLLHTLRKIFEHCGFEPIETPSMENLTTLMGKYGEEGDRLIFKVLNNGLNDPNKHDKTRAALENVLHGKNDVNLTERALRYDLTIPFARYVVMHQNELQFPFRRYQMQPVWRADRPQKGRYREFWQCDCDIVGSNSLINEAELLYIYREAFYQLQIPSIVVRVNSRKVLSGIAAYCGAADKLVAITTAIDKLDKVGKDGVHKELSERGLQEAQIEDILRLINCSSLEDMEREFVSKNIAEGIVGIAELRNTLAYHQSLMKSEWNNSEIKIDFTLARGLSYYTGIIVEVNCNDAQIQMGSIGGGGRYDDLTGLFGLKNLSGVGVSFGIDRIYDVMEQLALFPAAIAVGTKAMIVNTGGNNEAYAMAVLQQLRQHNIAAEIYPDAVKFDKQMKYIFNRGIPYAIIIEDAEREQGNIRVKDFAAGTQKQMNVEELINKLSWKKNTRHRELLEIEIDSQHENQKVAIIFQLNPSTAIQGKHDATTGKVSKWCKQNEFSKVCFLNLFSLVETHQDKLNRYTLNELNSNKNNEVIIQTLKNNSQGFVIFAFGEPNKNLRSLVDMRVLEIISLIKENTKITEISRVGKLTKSGYPRHGNMWNNQPALHQFKSLK